jgi:hypothetical protein
VYEISVTRVTTSTRQGSPQCFGSSRVESVLRPHDNGNLDSLVFRELANHFWASARYIGLAPITPVRPCVPKDFFSRQSQLY